jgi:hypothetical protein
VSRSRWLRVLVFRFCGCLCLNVLGGLAVGSVFAVLAPPGGIAVLLSSLFSRPPVLASSLRCVLAAVTVVALSPFRRSPRLAASITHHRRVTMPLKSDITEYLDEVTTESFITGACNTVVKTRKDGGRVRLVGTNTDFLGESGSGSGTASWLPSTARSCRYCRYCTRTALVLHSYCTCTVPV